MNALVQELKAALETMKDVDTELTAIQKVTNNTDAADVRRSENTAMT